MKMRGCVRQLDLLGVKFRCCMERVAVGDRACVHTQCRWREPSHFRWHQRPAVDARQQHGYLDGYQVGQSPAGSMARGKHSDSHSTLQWESECGDHESLFDKNGNSLAVSAQ